MNIKHVHQFAHTGFNLNKIAKVLSDDTVCLSKTFSQSVTGIHTDTKTDNQTGGQTCSSEGKKADN